MSLHKADVATQSLSRPSVARVCVEINLLDELPKRLWIGTANSGFWQSVEYENLPNYCHACKKIGHNKFTCKPSAPTHSQPQHGKAEKHEIWKQKTVETMHSLPQGITKNMHIESQGTQQKEDKEDVPIITEIVVQVPDDALVDSCQPLQEEEKQKDNVQALDLDSTKNNEQGSSRDFGLHVALIMDVDPMVVSKDINEKITIQDTCQPLQEEELLSESLLNKSDQPQITSAQSQIAQEKKKQSFTSGLTPREKELIAKMPDRPWTTSTRVVHSTEKKQTSKTGNSLPEPQQMLSFKLPEISQDNDMSETEESMDDHFDQADFIPIISKKQKARNKKNYSSSVKTMHTRQDSRC